MFYANKKLFDRSISMKKILALVLAIAMSLCLLAGCGQTENTDVVLTVDGRDVTWNEFMYWLNTASTELQSYYENAGKTSFKWDDPCMFDGEITNAEWCVKNAKQAVTQICVIANYADRKGISISDEEKEEIESYIAQYIEYYCGEDATEADFDTLLSTEFLTLDYYRQMMYMNTVYQNLFNDECGENGEKISDEVALAYGEDNGFITATHILFRTKDTDGNALDENTVTQKKAQAEQIITELRGISDNTERLAKFNEYKTELCEDSGKTYMPDGYCFTEGVMVSAFDAAARALGEYEIADLVESDYGYHVIMRLPQNPDITVSSNDVSGNLRYLAASDYFNDLINGLVKETSAEFTKQYKDYDFAALFGNDGFAGWLMKDEADDAAAPEESPVPEETAAP